MNLIFVITKNEIRTFRSNDGKTVSTFYISGEEIYEYDECYDFAEDLKDKLLAILNMHDLSEVAVDIAYIKGEKRAAEEILKEFIPCLRVQAVEFELIDNAAEVAEKLICITKNQRIINDQNAVIAEFKAEKDKWETSYNALEHNYDNLIKEYETLKKQHTDLEGKVSLLENKAQTMEEYFSARRYIFKFPIKAEEKVDIDWKLSDGDQLKRQYLPVSIPSQTICEVISNKPLPYGPQVIFKFEMPDIDIIIEQNYNNGETSYSLSFCEKYFSRAGNKRVDIYSAYEILSSYKINILKSSEVEYDDCLFIITHVCDTKEDALKWFEERERQDKINKISELAEQIRMIKP